MHVSTKTSFLFLLRRAAYVAAFVITPFSARAATYYWDNNDATNGFGTASGTWAATTTNDATQGWSTSTNGTATLSGTTATTTNDSVYFGVYQTNASFTNNVPLGGGTITVSGTVAAQNLFFGSNGNLTFSGGTLDLGGLSSQIQVGTTSTGGGTVTNDVIINSDITKSGGQLRFGSQSTVGETYIVNGLMSGGFNLDIRMKNNDSRVAFNGLNTFSNTGGAFANVTGQVDVNTISNVGVAQSLGRGTNRYAMGGGGGQTPVLLYTGTNATATDRLFTTKATGVGATIAATAGALKLTGNAGGIAISNEDVGTYGFSLSGAADSGTNEVSGQIVGGTNLLNLYVRSATLVDATSEAGVWKLSGSNSYAGSTFVQGAGKLIVANNWALGSTNAGTRVENTASLQFEGGVTVAEKITNLATGTGFLWNLSGTNTLTGAVTLNSANNDVRADSGLLIIAGGVTSLANQDLSLNGRTLITNTAINLGTGTLIATSQTNTLAVAGNTVGNVRINFGGTLALGVNDAFSTTAGIDWGWTTEAQSSGTLDLKGFNQTAGFLRQVTNSPTITGDQQVTGGGTLTLNVTNTSTNYTWFGRIVDGAGTTALVKSGAGTQIFANNSGSDSSYSGATTISNGVLQIAASTNSGLSANSAYTVNSGATLRVAGTNGTIGSLAGAGTVENTSSDATVVTVGGNNTSTTFSGLIQDGGVGTMALTKSGNATLTLSGSNTYTGATTVSAGSLIVNGSLGSSSVLTVAQSAIFGGSGVVGGAATISGILSPGNSPGTLTFSNNLTLNSTAETFMEIGGTTPGTGFDQILVSGTLAYNGKLTIASFGGWDLTQVNSYNLFDFAGYSGSLTNVNVGGFDLAWDNADTWTGTNGSTIYTFTENDGVFAASAVPEPSTYALLALSAAGFGWHVVRRRRR